MPVRVKCPTGHQLIVPDSRCGTVVICPRCDQPLKVPPAKVPRSASKPTASTISEPAAVEATRQMQAKAAVGPEAIAPPTKREGERPEKPVKRREEARIVSDPAKVLKTLTSRPSAPAVEAPAPEPPAEADKRCDSPSPPQLRLYAAETPPMEVPPAEPPTVPPLPEPPPSPEGPADAVAPPLSIQEPAAEAPALAPRSEPVPEPTPPEPVAEAGPEPPPGPAPEPTTEPDSRQESEPPLLAPPEPPPPSTFPQPEREGIIHEPARLLVAWQVAGAIALMAIFSMCPALIDIVDHLRSEESLGVGRWAWAVLLVSLVQLAYALYVSQLPDWTTLWVASLQSLAAAAGYAAVLGFVVTSRGDHWLLAFLQLSDQLAGGRAALWCIAMIAAMSLLAYFSGFVSVRWHKAELAMRALAARQA